MFELRSGVFTPEDVTHLSEAFERAVRALKFALPEGSGSEEARFLEGMVAERILACAFRGERNPALLAESALASMPPLRARWAE